jgi:hypothetical protein
VLLSLRLVVACGLMLVLEGLRDGAVIPDLQPGFSSPWGDPSGWLFFYERRVRQPVVKEVRAGGSSRNVSCRVSVGTGMSGWRMTFDGVCRRGSYRRLEAAVRRDALSSEEANMSRLLSWVSGRARVHRGAIDIAGERKRLSPRCAAVQPCEATGVRTARAASERSR